MSPSIPLARTSCLSDAIKNIAEPKESKKWPDTVQIFCTDLQHGRILAEYFYPSLRKGRRGQSDRFGQGAGHQHTNPRRLYSSFYLTGAEGCADHDSDPTPDAAC